MGNTAKIDPLDKAYESFLRNPRPMGTEEISKISGIHRPTINRILRRAKDKVLQSELKNWAD